MKRYRMHLLIGLVALLAVPAVHAQGAACRSVQFNDAVLERFPRAPEACLDVIERDGQKYAVYKADLVRTGRSSVQLRFKLPDGTHSGARTVKVSPARRVLIDGKPVRVEDLAVGQELTAYVKVNEPVLALAPANETESLDLQPLPEERTQLAEATTATMPATASWTHTYGLVGVLLLGLAGALALLRGFGRRAR